MAKDSYRVTPPFATSDYRIYSQKDEKIVRSLPKERADSRQYDEHRPIGTLSFFLPVPRFYYT